MRHKSDFLILCDRKVRVEKKLIRAGDIRRHPESQRLNRVLQRFEAKLGDYDANRDHDYKHVTLDAEGVADYAAIDGATRCESARKTPNYGVNHLMDSKVYINVDDGSPLTTAQASELFMQLNADRIRVSEAVQFKQAAMAGRPEAVETVKLMKRLGPKFTRGPGLWRLLSSRGLQLTTSAVDEVLAIWDATKYEINLSVIEAVADIMSVKGNANMLRQRRKTLRAASPGNWLTKAKITRLGKVGKRDALRVELAKKLLGKSNAV